MFHAPYTEKLLAKIGIYVYTPAHTRTCLMVTEMLLVPLCTQQLYHKLPQKGAREIALSVLFRHYLVPSCTVLAVLEETSFLGALQSLI